VQQCAISAFQCARSFLVGGIEMVLYVWMV
jgi:hypothetical protein